MHRLLVSLALLLPFASSADSDPRFDRLKEKAEPLASLASFLESYIGDCGKSDDSAECTANARAFRQKVTGRKFYMIVNEEEATMLSPGTYEPDGELTVKVAPFFASGGYALTHGAPKRKDESGNPVVMVEQAKGTLPEGWSASRLSRLFSTRGLRLQVVFTPQDTWTLPKNGGGSLRGVKAKIEAIYVTVGRTSEPVALWMPEKR